MSDYPGKIISKTAPTVTGGESGTASGLWTLDEQLEYVQAGSWPTPPPQREIYTMGRAAVGVLGDNQAVINRSSPVQIGSDFKQIDGNMGLSQLSVKTNGTLWAWGSGSYGKLGLNSRINVSSPTQVGALTTWRQVRSFDHTFAIKTDGTLWGWGYGPYGLIGDNSQIYRSSPVQIGSDTDWYDAWASGISSLALKTDGTMWSWGRNLDGILGIDLPEPTYRSSPVQIGALTSWSKIAVGRYHCFAIKTDGTLWTWGDNAAGQLGLGDAGATNRSSPVQVGSDSDWALARAGANNKFSIAVKTNGTIWSWGTFSEGVLGQNNAISYSSPVQIGALTSWSFVSCGEDFVFSIKTDGSLWAWGDCDWGKTGLNLPIAVNVSSPVQVGSDTNWESANAMGNQNGAAITAT